jgi:hypothetical protein
MLSRQELRDQYGADVLDPDEEKIGALEAVYVDDESKEPRYVSIKTGVFGTGTAVVPVKKDDLIQGIIRVGYTKEVVQEAPDVDVGDELDPETEKKITGYFDRHERREPEPLPPPGDILTQREATKGLDPEEADFDIPEDAAKQTI